MLKKTFKVNGLHCGSCAMVIEADLEDAGIKAICNFAKEKLDVEYDEHKFSETQIKEIVRLSGYSLDP